MPSPSRKLTTLWFADIAGFTRLSATNEPLALNVMKVMQRCVKTVVAGKHGNVIKFLGDGALAEFPSTEGAVEAALEAGALFVGGTRGLEGGPYQLHIGIHVGDVTVSDDKKDIFGDGVNRAARLQALGEPGEVLVSEEVYSLVRRRAELKFTSLGERTAKGLDEPFVVYAVEAKGELAARLGHLRSGLAAAGQRPVKVVPYPRAVGIGMVVAVSGFAGLAVWTGMGGTVTEVPLSQPIPDTLRLPVHEAAFAMPAWPPPAARPAPAEVSTPRVTNMEEAPAPAPVARAPVIVPPAPPPNSLAGLAQIGEQYMARLPGDMSAYEALPLLRRALNEARDGGPTGARADAIRGMTLFAVVRDPQRAEEAFRASLAEEPGSGFTRLMYAQLLTTQPGRAGEAQFQLEQARDKGVSNAQLNAARGALLFREGSHGDAKSALERSLRDDDVLATRILLARTLIAQNKTNDALRVLDKAIGSFEVVPWMAFARLKGGAQGAPLQNMVEMASREDAGYAGALLLLEAGDAVRALDVLERLVRDGDPDTLWLAVDPEWAPLHSDLRFRTLVNRVQGRR